MSIVVYDLLGKIVMVNPAFTKQWEVTSDQLPTTYSILNDRQLERAGVMPIVHRAFTGEVTRLPPIQYDIGDVISQENKSRWFQCVLYPIRDHAGAPTQIVSVHKDVTVQMEATIAVEARVTREERRVQELLQCTTDAVFMVDHSWNLTYLNANAMQLVSAGRELLGHNLWVDFPAAQHRLLFERFHKAMDQKQAVEFEEFYPEPLNKWLTVRTFPTVEGIAVFFRDATERRRAEQASRESEKLMIAGRLAASIAHEINNPLEAVTNLLYLVGGEKDLSPKVADYIRTAQEELHRVAEITTTTLQFFRQSTPPTPTDIQQVIESVLTLHKSRIRHSGVQVLCRFRPHADFISYAAELRQVLANFVRNALDATVPGDRIHLRVRPSTGSKGEPLILVTIADTGTGMDAETRHRIFDAFFTTKEQIGTGLGLWVSQGLIQKHAGTIRLRTRQADPYAQAEGTPAISAPSGRGTVFQIFLPRDKVALTSVLE